MGSRSVLTAFGESKRLAEWIRDPRCKVGYLTAYGRIKNGWGCEAALVVPGHSSTVHCEFEAWGEKKKLVYWLADQRCVVPASVFLKRLEAGMSLELALSTPEPERSREAFRLKPATVIDAGQKHSAFGEAKTLRAWSRDPRCQTNYAALRQRLRSGISLETLLTFPGSDVFACYWAFGESKALAQWLKDPRCTISPAVLKARLDSGERFESAITRPEDEPLLEQPLAYGRGSQRPDLSEAMTELEERWGIIKLTLFGETKTARQWTFDPRCEVSYNVLRSRIRQGWPEEPFILLRSEIQTPITDAFSACTAEGLDLGDFGSVREAEQAIVANGGQGTIFDRMRCREIAVPRTRPTRRKPTSQLLTAWGETKSVAAWARDPRCQVDAVTLYARLRTKQMIWTPEDAISTPTEQLFITEAMSLKSRLFEAFGETKTITEWAEDARCEVSYGTLFARILKGMPLPEALVRQRSRAAAPPESFGAH